MSHQGGPAEPTSEECSSNAEVTWEDNGHRERGFAAWYPQMGGYGGKCVVVPEGRGDACFDVYVWHDGEFPFSCAGVYEVGSREAAVLHHCSAQQFIDFGLAVQKMCRK